MNYRRVGKSGLKISEISLGAWLTFGRSVDDKNAEKIIKTAIDRGVNFIDNADIYARGKAEEAVGRFIKGIKRSDLVLSTKVYWPMTENVNDRGLSRKHIMESIDKSLKRLGTDYVDIYFCHRPDTETEVEETVRAMDDLVHRGKILYWGTSVWEADRIEKAITLAEKHNCYKPIVEQPRYNMLDRHIETEIVPTAKKHGMGFTVWSPLAEGLLTGKYNDGMPKGSRGVDSSFIKDEMTKSNIDKIRKLTELAKEHGITMAQLALAWILRRNEISCAIVGATKVAQLRENLGASDVKTTKEFLKKIDGILGKN